MASPVVTASFPTPTSTGVEGGIDVDVTVEIDGTIYKGGVTLINDDGEWNAWGSRDNWMDQAMIDAVDAADDANDLMAEIKSEAAAEIEAAA